MPYVPSRIASVAGFLVLLAALGAPACGGGESSRTAHDAGTADAICRLPCREGYVCARGACVEECNPPCPEGTRCVDGLDCVSVDPGDDAGVDPDGGSPRDPQPAYQGEAICGGTDWANVASLDDGDPRRQPFQGVPDRAARLVFRSFRLADRDRASGPPGRWARQSAISADHE